MWVSCVTFFRCTICWEFLSSAQKVDKNLIRRNLRSLNQQNHPRLTSTKIFHAGKNIQTIWTCNQQVDQTINQTKTVVQNDKGASYMHFRFLTFLIAHWGIPPKFLFTLESLTSIQNFFQILLIPNEANGKRRDTSEKIVKFRMEHRGGISPWRKKMQNSSWRVPLYAIITFVEFMSIF